MRSCIPFLDESLECWSNMKCDVLELLIFEVALGFCPSNLTHRLGNCE
ncbi:hypothetical protein SLEP1_g25730 [Rubroshorea leprosula]|uniref:Uncharacterized protein n=1 Tax=Rubroshorea leprosula TaxID=152421 RepID=A0AAV5JK71_9ROSI|nr:hypothetical protein SLEP1_g25730 [Rubroshorea leprosula]